MMLRFASELTPKMKVNLPTSAYTVADVERHAGFTLLTLANADGTEFVTSIPSTLRFRVTLPNLFTDSQK